MIFINGNWEYVRDLSDISKIIREYYNAELANELDNLIPEHTDGDYDDLESELMDKEDEISLLEDKIYYLEIKIEKLKSA